jgi:hypothetical protein
MSQFPPGTPFADAEGDPPPIDPVALGDTELLAWHKRAFLAAGLARRFTLRRRRWRKLHLALTREIGGRLLRHAELHPGCELCGGSAVVSHVIRGEPGLHSFHHYCNNCRSQAPSGSFGMSVFSKSKRAI